MKYCKIHFGRENLNKERYMFDCIKQSDGGVILLVPDQFTLQAEKEAFYYLKARGLMDLEVLSFSRLGSRILAETGGAGATRIDECGRYMLITRLAAENRDKLGLYKNSGRLSSFAQMANDLIYEMKQYNTKPFDISELIGSIDGNAILKQKLVDINLLYNKYEEYTKEKYLDGEDYIELFTSKIGASKLVEGSILWVYGFDYFTPKNMEMLKELIKHSREMNFLMTYDGKAAGSSDEEIFELTGGMIERLKLHAVENGAQAMDFPIPDAYIKGKDEQSEALSIVEKELFSIDPRACHEADGVTLSRAANIHSEIETAAAYTLELVRDHGMKYGDIAIICNDPDERARVAKRVFAEYGVDIFVDQKRSFAQGAAVRFITALLDTVINGYRNPDIFNMLKTGMTNMTADKCEELENYVIKYRIRGNGWKKEFSRGGGEYGGALLDIEESRREFAGPIFEFENRLKKAKTVRQKAETLYEYISETVKMPERLEEKARLEALRGLSEQAEETAQAWDGIVNILDQFVEIMGDEEISATDFAGVLKVGFESVELGILPPAADGLVLGTMQRMRLGRIKALIIIGANEGILPAAMAKEGLLSDDEKNWLFGKNVEICRREELRLREEQIAIYKNMSKPQCFLRISYSISDSDGSKLNPSFIFDRVREIFPELEVKDDIISGKDPFDLIQSKGGALKHMVGAMREALIYEKAPALEWQCAADWYRNNDRARFKLITDGLFLKNKQLKLNGELTEKLHQKEGKGMTLSPSRLEAYGKCPFAFFMGYGLSPDEMRIFEIAGREIGEIYHNCIMRFSKMLTIPGVKITGPDSKWMSITREESDAIMGSLIDEETGAYRDGVFRQGKAEEYRTERIKEVCSENAWTLVEHVRCGNILSMDFEAQFSRGSRRIPPIEMDISGGRKVLIEGKIDRVDVLADGSVKIIDYKSGKEKFNVAEAKAGLRLQLMLYLKAAQMSEAEPAGVFYFTIDEKAESGRMDGAVIDKKSVIDSIAGDFQEYSNIIPVKKLKDGSVKGNSAGNLLSELEFKELQDDVDKKVRELCDELISGCVDVRPRRSGKMTACTYCGYKSVCGFDVSFDGFKYENI